MLENEENNSGHLQRGFDAQWNDDVHHAFHVLLTGEEESYYEDYADNGARHLARCLKEGFAYQGEPSKHKGGKPRGTPSAALPTTSFVMALQNHDQIGNRALGDRLTTLADPKALRAAVALQLLAPAIPMIFMGEEVFETVPFLFFTDFHGELANAVREGRRREFARFAGFAEGDIPDPNDPATFEKSRPRFQADSAFYRNLLALRHRCIVPRLAGARAIDATAIGPAAVKARWRMADGATLTLVANLGADACDCSPCDGDMLYSTDVAPDAGRLAAHTTACFLVSP